ncbi:MAG: phenylalanine--tRNA ligase subunit beta [Vicinamibacterales bacterium]|nr:phenylalanine--tRNA ligase subunit beta [Vicinamibacterales bacterium]
MKILASWLREFVDVAVPPEELGQALSMRGFELASVDRPSSIVDRPSSIVGQPSGSDAVLDFEITANRPDALSVLGLARETATIYSTPLRYLATNGGPLALKALEKKEAIGVAVTLEAPDLCPRYAAAVVDVTVGPSPAWLASRLQAAGVRPVNNVVDVTNYVLLEIGQPMHAFDLARLAGSALRIRRATKGETIRTLDGTDRVLTPDMLVIADAEKTQAVAGVMGGGHSEVSAATKTVVLESACFNPKSVRLTSKRLGLKTEASARFERGADIGAPVNGLERAAALLEEIGAGRVRAGCIDRYPSPADARRLVLRRARLARVLGQAVPDSDVERILSSLGFAPATHQDGWSITVPTFRVDVSREIDLVEEVGRHYGYDRLPATFPALDSLPGRPDARIARDRVVRRVLLAAGLSEALTFTFIDAPMAAHFSDGSAIVPIGNPLSAQFAVLRPSLLPGLLTAVAHNRHRQRQDVRLFEIGSRVTRAGESRGVALAWIGEAGMSHWSGARRNADFFDVKGVVEGIGEALQTTFTFKADHLPPYLQQGRAAVVLANARPAGSVGMLSSAIMAAAGLAANEDIYVAELDLDAIEGARDATPLTVKPLPRYPSIARDISIVVDSTLPAETVRGTIRLSAPGTLVTIREFDRYQGKGVPDGRVSLSLRLTFRSSERTLTDAEVDAAMKAILGALHDAHNAVQR